jgi:hypothetical protein
MGGKLQYILSRILGIYWIGWMDFYRLAEFPLLSIPVN